MPIKCDEYNQVCVIAIEGDFSADTCAQVRRVAEIRFDNRQGPDFIIDFEKCGFIDSEGLETLLWLKRRAEEIFGQLKLAGLEESVRKILEITRLEHRFDCLSDVGQAIKGMR